MSRFEPVAPDSPRAWFMVAAAFLSTFVVFGVIYSFGAFFKPMAAEFQADRASTSAIFAATGFAYYMLGALIGRLSDRFGPRIVVAAGAILMALGLAATAFIDRLWVGYLTYGVGVGVGAACAYIPTLAVVGGSFVRRRNMALGIAAAGTGCGTMTLTPAAAALIRHYGWRTTDLIFAAGTGMILLLCAAVVRPPPAAAKPAATPALGRVVRSPEFVMLYISWMLVTTALFVPFVFLPPFARDHGSAEVAAAALIGILGGTSIIGRLGLGVLADRMEILPLFKITVLVMGLSYVLWLLCTDYIGLVAFAALLGVSYGGRISLMPGVLIEFFGLQDLGALLGLFFTGSGFASLMGPPLAGFIVDATGSYRWGIAFALMAGMAGFAAIAPLRERQASEGLAAPGH